MPKTSYVQRIITVSILILIIGGAYFLLNKFLAGQAFEKGKLEYRRGIGFTAEYFGNFGRHDINTVQDYFKSSIKKFEKYVKANRNDPEGYFMLANSHYMLYKTGIMFMEKTGGNKKALSTDDLYKAIEFFNKAISCNKKYAEAHYCLAMCYADDDFMKSYEELSRAKEYLSDISDSKKRAIWEEIIRKAMEGCPEMKCSANADGSKVKFVNISDGCHPYIAILTPGTSVPELKDMDCLFNKDDMFIRDLMPGKTYLICIGLETYIITGIITAKAGTLYTFNIRPLKNNFAIYDPKTMDVK
ncbi:MAG: hypothetical protein ABRQ39_14920 [Candidatus Eremiobacterota bacterium]